MNLPHIEPRNMAIAMRDDETRRAIEALSHHYDDDEEGIDKLSLGELIVMCLTAAFIGAMLAIGGV